MGSLDLALLCVLELLSYQFIVQDIVNINKLYGFISEIKPTCTSVSYAYELHQSAMYLCIYLDERKLVTHRHTQGEERSYNEQNI